MRHPLILLSMLPLLANGHAWAGEAEIRKALQAQFASANIESITKTAYAGLYEVVADGQVFYADADGRYLVLGNVIELKSQRNLTSERIQKLAEIKFDTLPFDKAIKLVKGNGKRKLAVFSDPDCPYCRKLEQELAKVDNVTIFTFLYPIADLHPKAVGVAKSIWCAKDRAKAWEDYMLRGVAPKNGQKCPDPVDEIVALGEKLRVHGTPTLVFENNRRVPGYVPLAQLEKMLVEAGKP
jgi:thiol:disulfide interchange protein DsbC